VLFPHDTKVDALAKAPLFSALSKQELGALAKATEDLEVEEGKVLTREGDLGREFFVIVEGEVSVTRDGNELRRLGPGEFFGEIALIYENARRTATVTSTSPLRFFVLTRQSFRSLLEHQPEIEDKVMAALEERLGSDSSD
jgi:CRP/FNR family transcriptional regulator, cyclic AMP receptor protein